MGSEAFVDPGTVRLELSDGENWIEVKTELTYGEQKKLENSAIGRLQAGDFGNAENASIPLEMGSYELVRAQMWIVDWSFTRGGKRMRVSRQAIEQLKGRFAEMINDALNAHIESLMPAEDEDADPNA